MKRPNYIVGVKTVLLDDPTEHAVNMTTMRRGTRQTAVCNAPVTISVRGFSVRPFVTGQERNCELCCNIVQGLPV